MSYESTPPEAGSQPELPREGLTDSRRLNALPAQVGAQGATSSAGSATNMVDWEEFYVRFREPNFLPGYEIAQRLGSGAFGEVYEATKLSIGKRYAVKFLRVAGEGDSVMIDRELSQARLFASIDHPNLVAVEDVGLACGVPYLIMGHAGEDTLARRMDAGLLPREQAFDIFVQVCRGVLALHDRQLAHFDIKPSNVFLAGENARIGDYGLSKLLRDDRNTLSFGRGTPRYMAPEILTGHGDRRADVFSLGILLFEVMTGELPFEDERSHLVPVASEALAANFPPDFAPELRSVVERCLQRNPGDRYASVAELLEDLGQAARRGDSIALPIARSAKEPKGAKELGPAANPTSEAIPRMNGTSAGSLESADVLEWQTLDKESRAGEPSEVDSAPAPLTEPAGRPGAPAGAAGAPIPPLRPREPAPLESSARAVPPRLPAALPVPPRLEGGPVATVYALGRTGFEIFVGLVVLPVLAVAHMLGPWILRQFDRLRRAGRFAWFALVCFGGGALLLLLLVWGLPS